MGVEKRREQEERVGNSRRGYGTIGGREIEREGRKEGRRGTTHLLGKNGWRTSNGSDEVERFPK